MLKKENYFKLKKEFGLYSSWAIWDSNDINVCPTDNDFGKLVNKYVFVAENASKQMDNRVWGNFHCKHRGGHDSNLMQAFIGTEYEGSYLTDILKGYCEPNGTKAKIYFKEHPEELINHFDMFLREVELLEEVETIFVLGNDASCFVNQITHKLNGIKVVKLTHYSSPSMYKRGKYSEYFRNVLGI